MRLITSVFSYSTNIAEKIHSQKKRKGESFQCHKGSFFFFGRKHKSRKLIKGIF